MDPQSEDDMEHGEVSREMKCPTAVSSESRARETREGEVTKLRPRHLLPSACLLPSPFRATSALSVCSARIVLHLRPVEGFSSRAHNLTARPDFPGICSFRPVPGPLRRRRCSGSRVPGLPTSCARSQESFLREFIRYFGLEHEDFAAAPERFHETGLM